LPSGWTPQDLRQKVTGDLISKSIWEIFRAVAVLVGGLAAGTLGYVLIKPAPVVGPTAPATASQPTAPPTASPPAPIAAPPAPVEDRIFVTTPVWDMLEPYRTHTQYQADKLFAIYKGKWRRIAGTIKEGTEQADGGFHTIVSHGPKDLLVSMTFSKSQAGFVNHLPLGTKIEASCKIDRAYGRDGLFVTDCELVKP
jgi:hypothetical protein